MLLLVSKSSSLCGFLVLDLFFFFYNDLVKAYMLYITNFVPEYKISLDSMYL